MGLITNLMINLLMKNLKTRLYFNNNNNNNNSLIVYVNHVLLGFYLCQSRRHQYYGHKNV